MHLPYTWGVPLFVTSVLLHWIISQSIFLARLAFYQDGQPTAVSYSMMQEHWKTFIDTNEDFAYIKSYRVPEQPAARYQKAFKVFNGIGYSDIGLLISIGLAVALMMSCRFIAGFRTYDKGLPIGGTNSAVISAACHVMYGDREHGKEDADITERPLKWGVTIKGGPETAGHLCFSAGEVEKPELGCLYAGREMGADVNVSGPRK